MAQIGAVTGMPRKRNQTEEMLARLGLLPEILSQQAQAKFQTAQIENMEAQQKLANKEFGLAQTQFGYQKDLANRQEDLQQATQQREMGVKAGSLGFSLATGPFGKGMTFGTLGEKAGIGPGTKAPTGSYWNTPVMPTLAGGLMGFAGGQIFGGKNKVKKSLIGAGIGGLAGYLGSEGNWGSALGGGLLGGLGGLI